MKMFNVDVVNHGVVNVLSENKDIAKKEVMKKLNVSDSELGNINEVETTLNTVDGKSFKITYTEIDKSKDVKFGGVEFSNIQEVVNKGF